MRKIIYTVCLLSIAIAGCKKEDGPSPATKEDKTFDFSRFKNFKFSVPGEGGTSTYIVTGGNIQSSSNFTSGAGSSGNFSSGVGASYSFSSSAGGSNIFDLNYNGSISFGTGGGSVTFDGTKYDLDYAYCADIDVTGSINTDTVQFDISTFVGIIGDFTSKNPTLDYVIVAMSTGKGDSSVEPMTTIGEVYNNKLYVVIFDFKNDETYISWEGDANIDGANFNFDDALFVNLDEYSSQTRDEYNVSATLECVEY